MVTARQESRYVEQESRYGHCQSGVWVWSLPGRSLGMFTARQESRYVEQESRYGHCQAGV